MATLKIPAEYLDDVRRAQVQEVAENSAALLTAENEDHVWSTVVLQRSTLLLDKLLAASGESELTSEHDRTSAPLLHTLEGMIRELIERMQAAAQYGPIPMSEVLDLTERVRWAAEQAIRVEPSVATRLSPNERRAA